MAFERQTISPEMQARLREVAAEMRELSYGAAGCPEWGTILVAVANETLIVSLLPRADRKINTVHIPPSESIRLILTRAGYKFREIERTGPCSWMKHGPKPT